MSKKATEEQRLLFEDMENDREGLFRHIKST
jgi:hypothetical protein